MIGGKESIYAKIKRSGNLPSLPEVLLKLLSACDNEDTTIAEIAEIISSDPGLSTRVLKLVNSAYYGFRHTFTSINQAVVYLGGDTIKNLAVTMSVHHFFSSKSGKKPKQFNPALFWYQSLMCGCVAKQIALRTGLTSGDEAYLGGLLHNIGQLTLASAFSEEYQTLNTNSTDGDLLELEEQNLGINHCEAGSWIIKQWELNPLIGDAILYHHSPLSLVKEAFPLVKVVYAANQVTENKIAGLVTSEACAGLFNLTPAEIDDLTEEAEEEVNTLATNIGIKATPVNVGNDTETQAPDSETPKEAETKISGRVKNLSLLPTFLEQLTKAETLEELVRVFERSLNLFLTVENILFFFPDENNLLLKGYGSADNPLHASCHGLTLPVQKDSNKIVSTFLNPSYLQYITENDRPANLADQQILSLLKSDTALPLPLCCKKQGVGVVVVGLQPHCHPLADNDLSLTQTLCRQLALSILLEKQRASRAKELQEEQLAAIAMTAKKFAHEINNPLGIISNYLVTLKMKIAGQGDLQNDINIISEELERISKMINQMQMFSQAPFVNFESIDLNSCIAELIKLANSSLFSHPDLRVSFTPGSNLPSVKTSRDAIKQIVINLLKNSAEAMAGGGRTIVRTSKSSNTSESEPETVRIIVTDNGPGLPDIVKENLFKPFVTTKSSGHSGLGLTITKKIVNDIGGELTCISSQEEGTTFTIILPVAGPEANREVQ